MRLRRLSTRDLLRSFFGPLRGLPAWGSSAWYGSWLRLHFGNPALEISQPNPAAFRGGLRRRRVSVNGDCELWLEMCNWRVLDGTRRRFHSDQRRMPLLRAGFFLEGRCLIGVDVTAAPCGTTFHFDDNVSLVVAAYSGASTDESLWHLYTQRRYLELSAGGRFRFGRRSGAETRRLRAGAAVYAF